MINNGLAGFPGISGVHSFADSSTDRSVHHLTVRNNILAFQRDGSSVDGNGNQLDHWTSDVEVSGNLIFGNDGVGISIFSASNNLIRGNVVWGNLVDSGGSHVIQYADIFIGEKTVERGGSTGNVVTGNLVWATNRYAAAIHIQAGVSLLDNSFDGNQFHKDGQGPLWVAGGMQGSDISGWNALPRSGTDSTMSDPPPQVPDFPPALLDRTLTLHSDHMRVLVDGQLSQLVAYLETRDLLGGAGGAWLAGDARDNVLVGVAGNNLISGGDGDDTLRSAAGDDFLFGGGGTNHLFGGNGENTIFGGSGDNHMTGGAGSDSIFSGNGVGSNILDGRGGDNFLTGGDGTDTFVIGLGVNIVRGFTPGQDRLDVSAMKLVGLAELNLVFSVEVDAGVIFRIDGGALFAIMPGFDARTLTAADFILTGTPPAEYDTVLTISATTASGAEGTGAGANHVFTVTRSGSSVGPAFARWGVTGEALAGTMAATADDFVGGVLPGGLAVFADGQTQQTISFTIAGDLASEPNESYAVTLVDAPGGVNIAGARAVGAIPDDDTTSASLSISAGAPSHPEGNSGATVFSFTVVRNGQPVGPASVDWAVTGSTGVGFTAATAADFVANALPSGSLALADGEAGKIFTVEVAGDLHA